MSTVREMRKPNSGATIFFIPKIQLKNQKRSKTHATLTPQLDNTNIDATNTVSSSLSRAIIKEIITRDNAVAVTHADLHINTAMVDTALDAFHFVFVYFQGFFTTFLDDTCTKKWCD